MTERFKDYVTGTAFALTLSRNMIDVLWQLEAYGKSYGNLPTAHALAHRGLTEWARTADDHPCYRLTDAGRAVLPLLEMAGLRIAYPPREPAVELVPAEIVRRTTPTPPPSGGDHGE